MKFTVLLLSPLFALQTYAAQPAQRAITLEQAFGLAVEKSEVLAASGAGIEQLRYAESQFRSAFRPGISGIASENLADGSRGSAQAALNLNYSIFSGMRDYIAVRASGLRTEAARLELARARQHLYLEVAAAYMDLASLNREIAVRRAQLETTVGRVKELENRAAIGRSRPSEVIAAKAQLAQDEAALASSLSDENAAQMELAFLTGLEVEISPQPAGIPALPELEPYLDKARARADVAAARRSLEAAQLEADAQKRLDLPSLDLGANYYLKPPVSSNNDVRWNAALTFRLPLYTGGYNGASAGRAVSRAAAAGFALALAERAAVTEVRQAYSALRHSLSVLDSLEKAGTLARENAALQAKDYTYGLVTNLDVLNAQNIALQTGLDLEKAKARAALAAVRLSIAAGLEAR